MTPFARELHDALAGRGQEKLYADLQSTYDDLLARMVEETHLPDPETISEVDHAKACCSICQQALLHRALHLFDASISSFLQTNFYATALCVRGHYETTASTGHVYKRVISLLNGHVELDDFHERIARQILGSTEIVQAPKPIHVLSMLQDADKIINREIFGGEKKNILVDHYNYLCEFAHPNFHSFALVLDIDRDNKMLHFKTDYTRGGDIIRYIWISNSIFVDLFDRCSTSVEQIGT